MPRARTVARFRHFPGVAVPSIPKRVLPPLDVPFFGWNSLQPSACACLRQTSRHSRHLVDGRKVHRERYEALCSEWDHNPLSWTRKTNLNDEMTKNETNGCCMTHVKYRYEYQECRDTTRATVGGHKSHCGHFGIVRMRTPYTPLRRFAVTVVGSSPITSSGHFETLHSTQSHPLSLHINSITSEAMLLLLGRFRVPLVPIRHFWHEYPLGMDWACSVSRT